MFRDLGVYNEVQPNHRLCDQIYPRICRGRFKWNLLFLVLPVKLNRFVYLFGFFPTLHHLKVSILCYIYLYFNCRAYVSQQWVLLCRLGHRNLSEPELLDCHIQVHKMIILICKCNIVVLLTKWLVRFKISFAHISDFKMTCTCTTCVFIHRTLPEHLSGVGSDGGRHLLRQLARRTLHLR